MRASTSADRRGQRRHDVRLPVAFAGGRGLTRNASATGVYFETDHPFAPGTAIDFELSLGSPVGPVRARCRARVTRVEPHGGTLGVAAQITSWQLAAADV